MAYKGKYKPKYPEKYDGDPTNLIYRSGWELKLMRFLDHQQSVVSWSSEEMIVPYRSPLDNRVHRYFPDMIAKVRQADGTIKTFMIEVKPYAQTQAPSKQQAKTPNGRPSRRFINEVRTYAVNQAKWKAAQAVCESRGWEFTIMTEHELGIKR